jgi:SAM-dependent methyltransferase
VRGYQEGFYTLSEAVRDPAKRAQKARKIRHVIEHWGGDLPESAICLDLGCSAGLIAGALVPLFGRSIGLDYDQIALKAIGPDLKASVSFLRGDAMVLPFADESIHVIICAQVYEHVPTAEAMFAEIARVLRPGGFVFLSGPNWLFPIEPHYHLPLLHWMPPGLADAYLRHTGRGEHYYERSFSYWTLRRLLGDFEAEFVTLRVLAEFLLLDHPVLRTMVGVLDRLGGRLIEPLLPNFNWLLHKPHSLPLPSVR